MGRNWREKGLVMLKAHHSCLLLTPLPEGLQGLGPQTME